MLEDGNMLQGGSVEDYFGSRLIEDPTDFGLVPDRTDYRDNTGQESFQTVDDVEQFGFVVVKKDKPRRFELGDCPGQFSADRTARTRNHNPFSFLKIIVSFRSRS